jgi:transposase
MAMGKRRRGVQAGMWVAAEDVVRGPGHPFYVALNRLLEERGFDGFVEETCREFYAETMGRPSLAPGVYFRGLLIGFFEAIDSERGIAWRLADSLTLREFVGYGPTDPTPDHSTISRTRRLVSLEAHQAVFQWVLRLVADEGLLKGKTVGIDATTLEANAAMRSIVRRETGEAYNDFLKSLAKAAGIETPTREDLARLDRKRRKKASNDDWTNPHDPDAKITKMKDGRTHLAYRAEHVTDLETSAIVTVRIGGADDGDTSSMPEAIEQAQEAMIDVLENGAGAEHLRKKLCSEIVADKGYHSGDVVTALREAGFRTYISEPDRGRRRWTDRRAEQRATYANRRRVRGVRGKRLMALRGERIERTFAHVYDTGGLRRVHVRGLSNVRKRAFLAAAGYDLGLVMRKLVGRGKPRVAAALAGLVFLLDTVEKAVLRSISALATSLCLPDALASFLDSPAMHGSRYVILKPALSSATSATGC